MKRMMLKARDGAMMYLKWGWPLLLLDVVLETWGGPPRSGWRDLVNSAAFLWVLCSPAAPLSLLLDRSKRERAMAGLCGLREGDERERAITGEAARAALLLGLCLQVILLVMSLIYVRLSWDPYVPKGEKHGLLSIAMTFSSSRHLDPFGSSAEKPHYFGLGASPEPTRGEIAIAGGFLLAPSVFPALALLILIELFAFRTIALRRYMGSEE